MLLLKQLFFLHFIFLIFLVFPIWADRENKEIKQSSITISGVTYTLQQALEFFLANSLDVQQRIFDFLERDTSLANFQKKYSWNVLLSSAFDISEIPSENESTRLLLGDERLNWDIGLGLSKLFSTGTTILFEWSNAFSRVNADTTTFGGGETPDYYKPSFSFSIKQELLKNWFGSNDRLQKKNYLIEQDIVQEVLKNQLAVFFVQILEIYWNITISTKTVENTISEKATAEKLYKVIKNNVKLGLAEKFDIYQYKSLLLDSNNRLLSAKNQRQQLVREFARLLGLKKGVNIEGITSLDIELPDLDLNRSVVEAFETRTDYLNLKKELQIAKNKLKMTKNELLPSVRLEASAGLSSQSVDISNAYKNIIPEFEYPRFSVYGVVSYPFGDPSLKISFRNAYFKIRKVELSIKSLEHVIHNEISNSIDLVKLNHTILETSIQSLKELEKYSKRFLNRANQGKYQYLQIKNVFDSRNSRRQKGLEALIQFNVSLLRYYLAKDRLFEKYGVNFETLRENLLVKTKR